MRLAGRAALVFVMWALGSGRGTPSTQAAAPIRLAVLDFEGSGVKGELADLGAGLQAMLTTDLAQLSAVTVIERRRLSALVKEIDFSRSQWADKQTALRVGKLAGASHVVFGTYTVVGKKLRIDCRLVQLPAGEVMVSLSSEGDLDAFFEVAKQLGSKMVAALAVKPEPKERAAMAKIQTADLQALKKFGEGLRLFENAKYEEAFSALEAATKADSTFDLAQKTLSDYRALISETRSEAATLRQQAMMERTRLEFARTNEKQVYLAALLKRAAAAKASPLDKLAAFSLLASAAQPALDDLFEAEQIAHFATMSYLQLALKRWPEVPLLRQGRSSWDSWDVAKLSQHIADEVKRLKSVPKDRKANSVSEGAEWIFENAELDLQQRTALLDQLQKCHDSLKEGTHWDLIFARARARRAMLDLQGSTRLLMEAKRRDGVRPLHLEQMATELEINESAQRALRQLPPTPESRELVMYAAASAPFKNPKRIYVEELLKVAAQPASLQEALQEARSEMTLWNDSASRFVLLHGVPLWNRNGIAGGIFSEPRPVDFFRTDDLNYRSFRPSSSLDIFVSRSLPADEHRFRIGVSLSPPFPDLPQAVVRLCLAFGMRNLRNGRVPGSLKAACVANNRQLQIVEGKLNFTNGSWDGPPKVLRSTPINGSGSYFLDLTQKSKQVRVEVEGASMDHTFDDSTYGFWGLFAEGQGTLIFGELEVK